MGNIQAIEVENCATSSIGNWFMAFGIGLVALGIAAVVTGLLSALI